MQPVLFQLGTHPVYSYGFFCSLAILAWVATSWGLSRREGLPVDAVLDCSFWCLVAGMAGARLLHVALNLPAFVDHPGEILMVWHSGTGFVFYGGPLLAVPFGFAYAHWKRLPPLKTFDVLMPGLALGHVFGRVGCFLSGCCHGRPTDLPWGVRLTSIQVAPEVRGIPIHPVQLYESAGALVLFGFLLWLGRRKTFDGQVGLAYLMGYALLRSLLEEFRGDSVRGFIIPGWISTSQMIALVIFVVAGASMIAMKRRGQPAV